jgi:hypothetical protein
MKGREIGTPENENAANISPLFSKKIIWILHRKFLSDSF